MRVRRATAGDWPAVAALLAELGRPDVLGTQDEDPARRVYEEFLVDQDAGAFVAEDDAGKVIGFVDVELRPRLNFLDPQAWIPDLIVGETSRRTGAGAALLAAVEELARERGCWSMALESATWRTEAHAFYEAQGWKDGGKSFTKLLVEGVWPPQPGAPASVPRSRA